MLFTGKPLGLIGVTDNDWFAFLSHQPGIDEVMVDMEEGTTKSAPGCWKGRKAHQEDLQREPKKCPVKIS
jgi:hypothetical protein